MPPGINKSGASASEAVAVPAAAVPKFATPKHVVTDGFWSNLKQFLTERPVKLNSQVKSTLMPMEYGGGFSENLKDYFSSRGVPKGPVNSRLAVNWGNNFGGFGYRLKEFFSPTKLPPLQVTSKPVKVKDIWSKDENFGWTQMASFALHIAVFGAIFAVALFWHFSSPTEAKNVEVTQIDLSPYVSKLPAGAQKAGGGGGANRSVIPPERGKPPKFKYTQYTPPQANPMPKPKLPMDPSLLGPPDLKVASPPLTNIGDPLALAASGSLGSGENGGIGSGNGGGLGPGSGGGTGGGAFHAGVNGVGIPQCIYCPDPQYSDEARKAKYQGTVVLLVTITTDGRAVNISVSKGVGLGLEEKAIEAVKTWKFKPAAGPSGKLVPTVVPIEVTFRLY